MTFTPAWRIGRTQSAVRPRARHRRVKTRPLLTLNEKIRYRVDSDTGSSVVTNKALLHLDGAGVWRRVAWSDIAAVDGSGDDGQLTLHLWPAGSAVLPSIRVAADARLDSVVRERLDHHRLLCVPVDLDGNTGAVIALREADGGVRWVTVLDRPTDEPASRRACLDLIAEIRSLARV